MAMLEDVMTGAPLLALGVAFFLLMALLCHLGMRLGRLRGEVDRGESGDGYLLSAVLALLGLLIGFTFSLSLSRYDSRREMVVAEGNAIGTAWLRATLVPGPEGDGLRTAMRSYGDIRASLHDATDRSAVEARSAVAQGTVWKALGPALARLDPPMAASLVGATNEMFDAASSRKAEREARIPGRVLDMVSLYALMAAGMVGYVLGRWQDRRHLAASHALFLLLSLAMVLILDLDRPWSGGITISPQPILDARALMHQAP